MGILLVQVALVVGLMILAVWWIFRLRPWRIRTIDLRRHIDYFLDMCEPESGLSFSRDGQCWPVRLSIDRVNQNEGELSLTTYTADLNRKVPPELHGSVEASRRGASQMRRPAVDEIVHLLSKCLGLDLANTNERIFVRGTPTIYGPRTEARIRDEYQTISEMDPFFLRRIRRYYERKTFGKPHNAMTSFRVLVNISDSHAPRYPHAARPRRSAA